MEHAALLGLVLFGCILLVAAVIDIKTRTVPHGVIIASAALWAVLRWVESAPVETWAGDLLAAGIVAGALVAFALVFERITGKESMGGGDIKLIAVIALYLGLESACVCLMVACLVAAGVALVAHKKDFPFVPALALGVAVVCCGGLL